MHLNPFNIPDLTITEKDGKLYLPQAYTGFEDPSWHLNEMQELLVPHIETDHNVLICAPTASGKSTAIYLYGAPTLKQDKAVLYVAPYKSLAEEKLKDIQATSHPWKDIPLMVVSGDHRWTKTQMQKASKARVICVTPEALLSVLRKSDPGKTGWLDLVGTVVFDEIHLITSKGRGVVMETMVMEVMARCRDARMIGLSATVSNPEDLELWFTRLTGRKTQTVRSTYRPVPIKRHFYTYEGACNKLTESRRAQMACRIAQSCETRGEQFLIAVWKKVFGNDIQKQYRTLTETMLPFHNAGLSHDMRTTIEQEYRMRQTIGIIATSTVFVGVNLPPRHLILTATHAGGDWIETHELLQAEGRAGRPKYDTEAHAHYIVSEDDIDELEDRLRKGCTVMSNFSKHTLVAAHFLGAVYMSRVQMFEDFVVWFKRTLYYIQLRKALGELSQAEIDRQVNAQAEQLLSQIIRDMHNMRFLNPESKTVYELTKIGVIAAQTLADPYEMFDLLIRLKRFAMLPHPTEMDVARLWGGVSSLYNLWAPKEIVDSMRAELYVGVAAPSKTAVAAAYAMMVRERLPEALDSPAYLVREFVSRYSGIMSRVKMETKQLENLNLQGFVTATLAIMRRKKLTEAMADLPQTSSAEFALLFSVGLFTIYDIRRHRELAIERIGAVRVDSILSMASERHYE